MLFFRPRTQTVEQQKLIELKQRLQPHSERIWILFRESEFNASWLKTLNAEVKQLHDLARGGIGSAPNIVLKIIITAHIKYLMSDFKSTVKISFMRDWRETNLLQESASFSGDSDIILGALRYKNRMLENDIAEIEKRLAHVLSGNTVGDIILRELASVYYYRFAKSYFEVVSKLIADGRLSSVPLFGADLTIQDINYLAACNGFLLFGMNYLLGLWLQSERSYLSPLGRIAITVFGFSPTILSALVYLQNSVAHRAGISEQIMQRFINPLTAPVLQFCMQLLFLYLSAGANNNGIVLLLMSQFIGYACFALADYVLQSIKSTNGIAQKIHYLLRAFGYPLLPVIANRYLLPIVNSYLFSEQNAAAICVPDNSDGLPMDERSRCRQSAFRMFDLSRSATRSEINSRFRDLSKILHPDTEVARNATSDPVERDARFMELVRGRDCLLGNN